MSGFIRNNSQKLKIGLPFAILLYGLALYFVPLQSTSFYFDDHISIESNKSIKKIDIPEIFNAFNTRFLVGLSFALNYKWCALNPSGYRLVNLLIHCLNAFLVYLLISRGLSFQPPPEPSPQGGGNAWSSSQHWKWPALFGSFLFLCHPIQTEAVNFITQRFVLMGTFFYLLTLFLYIEFRCRLKKKYLTASLLSAVAAMFCKEFVVTLPIMLCLYEFYFLNSFNEKIWKRFRRLIPFFIVALIVPLLLLKTPREVVGVAAIANSTLTQENNIMRKNIDITRARNSISRQQYFLTELNVMRTYVRLLFLPINQNFDYDYPISAKLDNKTLLSGLFLFFLLAIAWATYQSHRIISFSILWFFIALSVESSVIPIGHVIAEYRLYLASAGFAFLISTLIYTRQMDLKRMNMIAAVILIGFSILTYQRNKVWKDEFTLWNDTITKSPHKARPYNSRGLAYFQQGNFSEAILNYNKAINIDPLAVQAYINRGLSYDKKNDLTQAILDNSKAIELEPDNPDAYINRGYFYDEEGNSTQALSDYDKAIELAPHMAEAYNSRGSIYSKQGNWPGAIADFNKAISINPDYADVYCNRGIIYEKEGKIDQAIADCAKTIELNPQNAEAYFNLGDIYTKKGDYILALSHLNKAIELNPTNEEAYNTRSLVYSNQGNLTQAILDCNKAIEINPKDIKEYNNCGLINAKQGNSVQSLSYYNRAIELNPQYALAYYNRAISNYQLRRFDNAWADAHKAEELGYAINPGFINALKQVSGREN